MKITIMRMKRTASYRGLDPLDPQLARLEKLHNLDGKLKVTTSMCWIHKMAAVQVALEEAMVSGEARHELRTMNLFCTMKIIIIMHVYILTKKFTLLTTPWMTMTIGGNKWMKSTILKWMKMKRIKLKHTTQSLAHCSYATHYNNMNLDNCSKFWWTVELLIAWCILDACRREQRQLSLNMNAKSTQ